MSLQMISCALIILINLLSDFPTYVSSSTTSPPGVSSSKSSPPGVSSSMTPPPGVSSSMTSPPVVSSSKTSPPGVPSSKTSPPGVSSGTHPCPPIVTGPGCPQGYFETPHPKACVVISPATQDHAKSKEYCENLDKPHSSLWVSYNKAQTDQLTGGKMVNLTGVPATKSKYYIHIGLTKKKQAGAYLWLNGQRLRSTAARWDSRQPNYKHQTAVGVNLDGDWHDLDHDWVERALCMTRHQIGPREFGMSMVYHDLKRGPTVIYKGRDFFVTCTVFIPAIDSNVVSIRDVYGSNFTMVSRSNVSARNSLNMCTNKVSLEMKAVRGYSAASHEGSTNRAVQCYARPLDSYDTDVECNNNPNEFCKKFIFPMKLLDPPIEKPTLKIDINGNKARIECKVNVGITGKLTWVLYFKNSKIEFIQDNDTRIHDKTRDINHASGKPDYANNTRWIEQATLLLDYGELKGIRVACFDHSITKYNLSSTCVADDLYCDIKILAPNENSTEEDGLGIVTWLGIIFIIGAILGALLFALTMQKGENVNRGTPQKAESVVEQNTRESQVEIYTGASQGNARPSQAQLASGVDIALTTD